MDNNKRLHLTENFIIACEGFSIDPLEAIQFFISKITVYTFIAKNDNNVYAIASDIFDLWLAKNSKKRNKMEENKRLAGIKYVKEIMTLMMSDDATTKKDKTYIEIIDNWYNSIAEKLPSNTVQTTGELTAYLTKDFYILCDIFKGSPLGLLQYYVDHVSILVDLKSADKEILLATGFFLEYPPILKLVGEN